MQKRKDGGDTERYKEWYVRKMKREGPKEEHKGQNVRKEGQTCQRNEGQLLDIGTENNVLKNEYVPVLQFFCLHIEPYLEKKIQ